MEKLPYIIFIIFQSLLMFILLKLSPKGNTFHGEPYTKRYSTLSKLVLIFDYIYFILFTSFRKIEFGLGGTDAYGYKMYFINSKGTLSHALEVQNYEIGYSIFIWMIRLFTENYIYVMIIIYTFLFFTLIHFIKYITMNRYSILTLILLLGLIINSFNTTRVIIAVFMGMIVYILLYKKKIKTSLFVAFLAITIHVSALILIPMIVIYLLFINKENIKFSRLIGLVSILSVVAFVALSLIDKYISAGKYSVYGNNDGIATQTYIMIIIIFILSFIRYDEMIQENIFNKVLIILLPLGLLLIPLQLKFSILYRMVLYFLPIIYALIPSLIVVYKVDKFKNIYLIFIRIGLILYLLLKIQIFIDIEIVSSGLPYINYLFNK